MKYGLKSINIYENTGCNYSHQMKEQNVNCVFIVTIIPWVLLKSKKKVAFSDDLFFSGDTL